MTAKTRTIRPHDLAPVDLQADLPADLPAAEGGPIVLARLALPFNDNAREAGLQSSLSAEADASLGTGHRARSPAEALDEALRSRRRGPLVTRWIGFAAQRRHAQARAGRLRDRRIADGSGSSDD